MAGRRVAAQAYPAQVGRAVLGWVVLPRLDGHGIGRCEGDRVNQLSLGVMARSLKENERRLPIHPDHLGRIPDDLRGRVYLERGYGDRFGVSDDQLTRWVGGLRTREQLVEECDVILQFLAEHDVVVNCVLQDTDAPLTIMTTMDLADMTAGSLIVDVSCDEAMGFSWARPTTFEDPTFVVGDNVLYYAVDHSPSYLWNSATWEISEALLPFLRTVVGGPAAWDADPTIGRAIEIRDGVIQNPAILSFQGRAPKHPHWPLAT